eukprot:4099043-Amphidinium_carterae.1
MQCFKFRSFSIVDITSRSRTTVKKENEGFTYELERKPNLPEPTALGNRDKSMFGGNFGFQWWEAHRFVNCGSIEKLVLKLRVSLERLAMEDDSQWLHFHLKCCCGPRVLLGTLLKEHEEKDESKQVSMGPQRNVSSTVWKVTL